MQVFVTVEPVLGVLHEARTFMTEASALRAEAAWLDAMGITTQDAREGKSDDGTSFTVMECDLKP